MPEFTAKLIHDLQPKDKDYLVWDSKVSGFAVRVTKAGSKSYLVKYRVGGGREARERKPTLGKVGQIGLKDARALAAEYVAAARKGEDLSAQAKATATAPTMARLAEDYLTRHAVGKRSADEDRRRIETKVLPRLGKTTRVKDVSIRDLQDLHERMKKTPVEANRTMALLSKMFALAVQWEWVDRNPASSVTKYPEEKRERFLDAAEIALLDDALDEYEGGADAVDAIRLLLLTGCRSGELLAASWDQFDLARGIWTKPSSHTKTKKVHKVTLSAPAVALLHRLKDRNATAGSQWVLPGVQGRHRKSLRAAWHDIRARAGLDDVRIHDLRHTSASLMLSAGVPLDVVGRVLGHTQAQTTLRYAHLTDEASKAATDTLGNVVPFKQKEAKAG